MTRLRHLLHSMIKVSAVIKAVVAGEAEVPTSLIPTETFIYLYLYTCPADGRKDLGSYCYSHYTILRGDILIAEASLFTRHKSRRWVWYHALSGTPGSTDGVMSTADYTSLTKSYHAFPLIHANILSFQVGADSTST